MTTVTGILWLAAFVLALFSAGGKVPIWVAVILICIAGLLGFLPL